ncbi:MAG TPA: hypothetical protein VL098_12865 [Flavipsychrobacter sp.]|nr:hypothetical protein [Flavipsychrobacter sp.]
MNHTKSSLVFIVAIVLLQSVYFFIALQCGHIYNGDSFEYIQEAINIKEQFFFYSGNRVLPLSPEYMTLRTPGYPLFLLAVYLMGINNWVVLFLQNLICLFNILYCRQTLQLLGYQPKYDAWLVLFLLFFPSQFVYTNLMAPDILLQTCTLIYFRYAVLFLKERQSNYTWYMAAALIAGLFIKPVLYPFAAIHLLMIIIYSLVCKSLKLKSVLATALLPLMCIGMYSYGNKIRTGKFHFSSIQSFNAIFYYQRYFSDKVNALQGASFIEQERSAIAKLPAFADRYDRANARGIELLRSNFVPYISYHLGKSCMFFLETGRGELDEFTGRSTLGKLYSGKSKKFITFIRESNSKELIHYLKNNTIVLFALGILFVNILKIIGMLFFLIKAPVAPVVKWFTVLFILYFALITGPISNAHYVLPISLIGMCCSITGFMLILRKTPGTLKT